MEKQPITRELATQKYKEARTNLYMMIVLTAINIVLLFVEADYMLLFSATVPYFFVGLGLEFIGSSAYILIMIGIVILLVYLAMAIFSKNHYGFMIVALVLFAFDTLFMLGTLFITGDFSGLIDILVHIWVLYYLIMGVRYGNFLTNLPETVVDAMPEAAPEVAEDVSVEE